MPDEPRKAIIRDGKLYFLDTGELVPSSPEVEQILKEMEALTYERPKPDPALFKAAIQEMVKSEPRYVEPQYGRGKSWRNRRRNPK